MTFLIVTALIIALSVYLGIAIDERQQARLQGQNTQSLWFHFKRWLDRKKRHGEGSKEASPSFPKSPPAVVFNDLPEPEPDQAPVGPWHRVATPLIEFEYPGEAGPIGVHVARVCDSHIAGPLEDDPIDAPERVYALSDIQGAVRLPLDEIELIADQLRDHLLTQYPDDHWEVDDELDDVIAPAPRETGNLRFIYRDADGNKSTRELINFRLTADTVRGVCLDRNAIRTFKLARIVTFLEGEELLYATEGRAFQRSDVPDPVRDGDPEITFSGFDAKTRSELEKIAKAHGFVVRKSVTKNLDYFVAGPRRSAPKEAEAEGKPSCSMIDKEGFLWLIATGEVLKG